MGRDKASLLWGESSLLEHAIGRMRQVTARVVVSGDQQHASAIAIPDMNPGCGPLGGLRTCLAHSDTDWNLVLAVDMPLASPELLRFIAERCHEAVLAAVPSVQKEENSLSASPERVLQPLCAAYHRRLLPLMDQALVSGDFSIHRLLERVSTGIMSAETKAVRVIGEDELLSAGFSREMLFNINTPEDLERARTLARTLHVK